MIVLSKPKKELRIEDLEACPTPCEGAELFDDPHSDGNRRVPCTNRAQRIYTSLEDEFGRPEWTYVLCNAHMRGLFKDINMEPCPEDDCLNEPDTPWRPA